MEQEQQPFTQKRSKLGKSQFCACVRAELGDVLKLRLENLLEQGREGKKKTV
jgi:hypothetical protein